MNLKNTQYDMVMRHYEEIREAHRLENDAHLEELRRTVPSYDTLSKELSHLYAQKARYKILGKDDSTLSAQISELIQQRKQSLTEAGYPENYADMTYSCSLCHDTGYVEQKRCICFNKIASDILYRCYAPKDISEEDTIESFKTGVYSDKINPDDDERSPREMAEEALRAAKALLKGTCNNLLIFGHTGVGKTYLSYCILNEALNHGRSALYFSAGDLFDILADAAFNRSADAAAKARLIENCDLLIIDDLGTELKNELTETELFRLINERLSKKVCTVISTNLRPAFLTKRYSERIVSRLMGGFVPVKLSGQDLRMRF
ncbi:MAG: ATP-binding protein [Lachnospiraceae bacterium]|nr:ATP-binding protein [Candidatus Equihabitans merdae]